MDTSSDDRDAVAADEAISPTNRSLYALVEAERRRLGTAEAILASLSVALDHANNIEADRTQFGLVVEAVRDLIVTSMESLDSTRLKQEKWRSGSVADFLNLSDQEAALVEMRTASGRDLRGRARARGSTRRKAK